MSDSVGFSLLIKLSEQTVSELRQIRKEMADVRTLALQSAEYNQRLNRRLTELADDLGLMVKSELMGQLANLETRIEIQLDRISERVAVVEGR
jgi:hypothetical protein